MDGSLDGVNGLFLVFAGIAAILVVGLLKRHIVDNMHDRDRSTDLVPSKGNRRGMIRLVVVVIVAAGLMLCVFVAKSPLLLSFTRLAIW